MKLIATHKDLWREVWAQYDMPTLSDQLLAFACGIAMGILMALFI